MWDILVEYIFHPRTFEFGSYQSDSDRAFAWLTELRNRAASWKEARAQMEAWLQSKGAPANVIQRELAKAESMMKPWLDMIP